MSRDVHLTLVRRPDDIGTAAFAEALAQATGVESASLRQALRQPPPSIVACLSAPAAAAGARVVSGLGGDACTPSVSDLARLGASLKIRDLRLGFGAFEVDLWHGPATRFAFADVDVLVRATLRGEDDRPVMHIRYEGSTKLEFAMNAPGRRRDAPSGPGTSDKLDLHTRNGMVYQLDGDKFGYRVLGAMRGHSDRANMDRMCELIAHLVPDVVVDTYFPLFRMPPGGRPLPLPDRGPHEEDPVFAFYSRWTAFVYRHVMGTG